MVGPRTSRVSNVVLTPYFSVGCTRRYWETREYVPLIKAYSLGEGLDWLERFVVLGRIPSFVADQCVHRHSEDMTVEQYLSDKRLSSRVATDRLRVSYLLDQASIYPVLHRFRRVHVYNVAGMKVSVHILAHLLCPFRSCDLVVLYVSRVTMTARDHVSSRLGILRAGVADDIQWGAEVILSTLNAGKGWKTRSSVGRELLSLYLKMIGDCRSGNDFLNNVCLAESIEHRHETHDDCPGSA